MIYDTDLIDHLVALIQAATWSQSVADVRRVWGGDVAASEIPEGRVICQLWPDEQRHNRSMRSGPWSLTVDVGLMFAMRLASRSMAEVDAALHSFDELLVSEEGLGGELFDVVEVSSERIGTTETATFVRANQMLWPIRPNPERLQRAQPDGDQEQYAGLLHCKEVMTYTRI